MQQNFIWISKIYNLETIAKKIHLDHQNLDFGNYIAK